MNYVDRDDLIDIQLKLPNDTITFLNIVSLYGFSESAFVDALIKSGGEEMLELWNENSPNLWEEEGGEHA